jgi:hydroxypyruvate isomerase
MIKSVCIETIFTEVPFKDRFELAKQNGFDYVEFWSWKDKDIDEIKQICDRVGIKISSFSGDQNYSLIDPNHSEKYISFIKESIETAKYLNCNFLVIHSNALDPQGLVINDYSKLSDYKKIGTALKVLKELAPIVERENITLVLEALNTKVDHVGNFLCNTKTSAELVEMVNSLNIKILYDIYHMQIMEGDIITTLRNYIDRIAYIHIADIPGRHEPGTGEINYNNVIKALNVLKFEGVVGFELFPKNNSHEAIKAIQSIF